MGILRENKESVSYRLIYKAQVLPKNWEKTKKFLSLECFLLISPCNDFL